MSSRHVLIVPKKKGLDVRSGFTEDDTIAIMAEGLGVIARQTINQGLIDEREVSAMIAYRLAQTLYPNEKKRRFTKPEKELN